MFPTTNSGSNTTLTTQPISGDSLTKYFRSLSNQIGQTGAGTFNTGAGVFGQGVTGVGGAQDTASKALATLDPSTAYWMDILKGGPAATAAVAPYATMVGQNYANAGSAARSGLPSGGYSSTIQAGLPFAQSRDVNNALLQLQPTAASALNTNAATTANIGGLQGNLASLLLSGGLGQETQGSNLLTAALQSLLQKMGINVTESGQNKTLASNLIGDATGAATNVYGINKANCWIAEAIYGVDDIRTHLVRAWLNGPFRQRKIGQIVMSIYSKIGRQVARCVRKSKALRGMLKPLFDKALRQSVLWLMEA